MLSAIRAVRRWGTLVLALGGLTTAWGQFDQPSPRSLQLHVGAISYNGSDIWNDDQIRNWAAERYSAIIGANNRSDIVAMKAINPDMKVLVYDIYCRFASDTVRAKQWAAANGVDFETMILRVKPTASPVTVRVNPNSGAPFSWWRTTQPGGILIHSGFTSSQTRFAWDYRSPAVGRYLADVYTELAQSLAADGIMMDEEGIVGVTGNFSNGLYPLQAPFREGSSLYWQSGSIYSSFIRPWSSSLSHDQVRDSLRTLRSGWMGLLGATLNQRNLLLVPNWASSGGPYTHTSNWDNEARKTVTDYARGYLLGEYCFINPSGSGQEDFVTRAVYACSTVANRNVEMWVWPIRVGQFDSSATDQFTIARSKMNALGFMLDALFPGSTYRFLPHPQINVLFQKTRTLNGMTLSDTLTNWDNSWGKYFGEPRMTRDRWNGTDPSGQSYRMNRVELYDPDNPSEIQTLAIGRYARGDNRRKSQTSVPVSLGGAYHELLPGGGYSAPVIQTTIANAEWRIFVKDTSLANTGFSSNVTCTGSDGPCTGSTGNLNCLDDNEVGLTDLVLLIDYLFLAGPLPCCPGEANVNGDPFGRIDLADMSAMINHLFIAPGNPLPPCAN